MLKFICPVCGEFLCRENRAYICKNRHSFDIAKQGYVNLLQSNQSKLKRHGDDKLMINSRFDFLNKGYYEPLLDRLCKCCEKYLPDRADIIDAGCGDCYYSSGILERCSGRQFNIFGVDISKDAVIRASKRNAEIRLAIGSVFSLPFPDGGADAILNIFSPFAPDEYRRILKRGAYLFRVVPLENHLYSLKEKIYDTPYRNTVAPFECEGFEIEESIELKYIMHIQGEDDVEALFKMTPYYYKTSITDQRKLSGLQELDTEAEFLLLAYRRL